MTNCLKRSLQKYCRDLMFLGQKDDDRSVPRTQKQISEFMVKILTPLTTYSI